MESGFAINDLTLVSARTGNTSGSLDQYLRDRSLEPMARRTPVLAVGSNACPPQIILKFRRRDVSLSIPTLRVRLAGYGVGFVPMFSSHGYVPATLVADPSLESNVFVQFLDDEQLAELDRSEGIGDPCSPPGAYCRAEIRGVMDLLHHSRDGAEPYRFSQITSAYSYVSTIGALTVKDRLVLADNDQFGLEFPEGPPVRIHDNPAGFEVCYNQDELVDVLKSHNAPLARKIWKRLQGTSTRGVTPASDSALFGSDWMQAGPWQSDGASANRGQLNEEPLINDGTVAQQTGQSSKSAGTVELNLKVRASGDDIRRDGESVVVLSKDHHMKLGKPNHVVVQRAVSCGTDKTGPRAIARALSSRKAEPGSDEVQVDEVLRNAICARKDEDEVVITPLQEPWAVGRFGRRLLLAIFGRPNFVTARVKKSDITTMERDVALVTPLTLQMLGIEPGEFAVLEGVTPDGIRRSQSVRVIPTDEQTVKMRQERRPGPKNSGPYPLPELWIDSALRNRLTGSGGETQNDVIRMRASVAEQVQKELREFFLIVLLSILTWVLASPSGNLALSNSATTALIGVVLLAAVLLIARIRWRYKHTAPSRFIRRESRRARNGG